MSVRPMSPVCSAEIPLNLVPGLGVGADQITSYTTLVDDRHYYLL